MLLFSKKYLLSFLFIVLISSVNLGQGQPYLSAPVNGSTWELTTPTLYWWYVPTPYSAGPFNYTVQVSTSQNDFSDPNLLVNTTITSYGVGTYPINTTVGLIQGVTYYWRVGVNGTYSSVWSFSPYNYGGVTTYNITAIADAHGSISPSGSLTVARGASRTFVVVPDPGYTISDLIVDNFSVGALSSYSFTNITSSHSIRATFAQIPFYDTVFVSISGSDADGDGTKLKPYRKIQRGHDKSKPDGIVYVYDGAYLEDVVLTKPIKIVGQSTPSTRSFIIRANDITIKNFNVTQSSPGPGIQKIGLESYNHLENLKIENVRAYNNAEMGLLLINIDNVEVKNCNFYGNDMGGISIINCKNVSLTNIALDDNLRGLAVYNTNDITINQLFAQDNGKAYLALYPDKNGLMFSLCNNISLTSVISNKNEEQGIKFEDCSIIKLNNVSANNNITDGLAFIESDQITYNTGTVSKNGTTVDDNGIEIVGCDKLNFNTVAVNENFNIGILFDLFYKGVYKWDPTIPIPAPLPRNYYGPTTDVSFTDVSANLNGSHGIYGLHLSYATLTNPTLTGNLGSGFEIDAAHHIYLVGGKYDSNFNGIALKPTINVHPIAPKLSTDEVTNFSLTGDASISNNTASGIVISPLAGTKVTEPLFYGKFNLLNNGIVGLKMGGKVTNPIFSGLYFKSTTTQGVEIFDLPGTDVVSGVKINNSFFDGYSALVMGRAAISLANIPPAMLYSVSNVDAKNNVFVGAADQNAVESMIFDKTDVALFGKVTTTGWTSGQPSIKIGSASAYTASLVTIPITLDISAQPLSFTQLMGKITFNEHKLRYKYTTYGAGTIVHDAGWGIVFDHTSTDELRFITFGFNAINTSGVLFSVTFEVADVADGSENVSGLTADWTINGGLAPFVVYNGKITYSASPGKSIMKGDPTMNFAVDNGDYIAVLNHVNGITLTGQAFLNADVNKDTRVDELDAADIFAYINTGVWPGTSTPPLGDLSFARASVDQQGILRFPITLNNSSNVRSLQIEFKYDDTKLDFRNFIQLMQGKDYFVEAQTVAKGTTKLLFTTSSKSGGNLVPAELFFNLKNATNTSGLIKSTYSINGTAAKVGPSYGSSSLTDVELEKEIPTVFSVEQNYPNPFNPTTTIKYALPKAGLVSIKIYDILGRLVKTLVNTEMLAGKFNVVWDGDNQFGHKVASGTYFYQVINGSNVISKKMLLIK